MAFSPANQSHFANRRRQLQDLYWLRQLSTGFRPDPGGLHGLTRLREQEKFKQGGGMFGPIGPGTLAPVFEATEAMNPGADIEIAGGRGQDPTSRQFRGDLSPSIVALRRTSRQRQLQGER
jgi:hypothetical protein